MIEQVISELKDGPLAHLPSGRFPANAAWLQFAVLAFNLSRAAAHAAGMATARMATILSRIICVPARLASRARRLIAHLPQKWPYSTAWMRLWTPPSDPQATASPDHRPAPTGATGDPTWKSQSTSWQIAHAPKPATAPHRRHSTHDPSHKPGRWDQGSDSPVLTTRSLRT